MNDRILVLLQPAPLQSHLGTLITLFHPHLPATAKVKHLVGSHNPP